MSDTEGEYEAEPVGLGERPGRRPTRRPAGREANTLRDTGLPIIIVTSIGNKTGKVRKTPLMKVEHDGEYALGRRPWGRSEAPGLVLEPQGRPDLDPRAGRPGAVRRDVRELDGDERAEWWERAVAAYPPYAEYQERTDG